MSDQIKDDLINLYTHAIDARHGYEEALEDADGRGMTPLFREMTSLHTTNATELAGELARYGEHPDEDGSFMSTVHRTVISVRALFGGLDGSVLPGLIDGEKRNISTYDKILDRDTFAPETRALLARQRDRLEHAVISMEGMQAHAS